MTDRFAGARLQQAAFPDDTGGQDPALVSALADWRADPSRTAAVLAALQAGRLLVPVVAVATEVAYDERGLAHDKSSDMAAVLLRGRDGRLALLAFSGTGPLTAWDTEARPVAVPSAVAAASAIQDDAAALVLDVAGPVPFVVTGEDLMGLAGGWQLAEVDGRSAWLVPEDRLGNPGRPG